MNKDNQIEHFDNNIPYYSRTLSSCSSSTCLLQKVWTSTVQKIHFIFCRGLQIFYNGGGNITLPRFPWNGQHWTLLLTKLLTAVVLLLVCCCCCCPGSDNWSYDGCHEAAAEDQATNVVQVITLSCGHQQINVEIRYYNSNTTQIMTINFQFKHLTSLPFFGVRLSCICLMFAYKENSI